MDIYIDGVSTEVWQFPDSKLVFLLQCYQVAFISKCFPEKTSDIFWLLQLEKLKSSEFHPHELSLALPYFSSKILSHAPLCHCTSHWMNMK